MRGRKRRMSPLSTVETVVLVSAILALLGVGGAGFLVARTSAPTAAPAGSAAGSAAITAKSRPAGTTTAPTRTTSTSSAGRSPMPSSQPPMSSSPAAPVHPSASGASSRPTQAPTTAASVLQRHDSLPAGIEATVSSYFGGADGATCTELEELERPGKVGIRVLNSLDGDDPLFGVGEWHTFCMFGFVPGSPVQVVITDPAGRVHRSGATAAPNGTSIAWGSVPGDPVGRYRLEARQETTVATMSFRLDHQLGPPLLRVVKGEADGVQPTAGSVVRVALAGFSHDQVVRLLLYRAAPQGAGTYITSVEVRTDAHGERLYPLQTAPSDPAACFILRSLPTVDFRALSGDVDFTDAFCLS